MARTHLFGACILFSAIPADTPLCPPPKCLHSTWPSTSRGKHPVQEVSWISVQPHCHFPTDRLWLDTDELEDGIEEVSPGVVAAAAAARRVRGAGSHGDEGAMFRELEQAERGFFAGAGASRSEAAGGTTALF